ncbi:hypothetical protein ACL02T_29970 [Pseudonocardia sp. RS010]|uniref:hypothetical protein n=1 Tax=Pseudonocardia sp. RS010 TaxID=3385979 RepID=UPI00399F10C7
MSAPETAAKVGSAFDLYNVKTRLAPAALVSAPLIALGLAALPLVPPSQRYWSLVSLGLLSWVALTARDKGNDAQRKLWEDWGGAPTTHRLRYRSNASEREVARRHREIEKAINAPNRLPSKNREVNEPHAADAEYIAATRRLIDKCREVGGFSLLDKENRNYGFARNLYSFKRWGIVAALLGTLGGIIALVTSIAFNVRVVGAGAAVATIIISVLMLALWRTVTPKWVKPSADAYADRLMAAAARLSEDWHKELGTTSPPDASATPSSE